MTALCPYCGVGCQLTYNIKDDKLLSVDGRDGPSNQNRLCVKGRFGFDYVHHEDRLTVPLIRREGVSKHDVGHRPGEPAHPFPRGELGRGAGRGGQGSGEDPRRDGAATRWPVSDRPRGRTRRPTCSRSWCGPGFGTNNVDHCTRLCHASSVTALIEGIGSGAVTAPFMSAKDAEVIVVIGANPTENHPVAATFFKNAVERGAKLVVMDPRGQALKRFATHMLQFKPGRDVAMLNAMLNVIITEGLYDQQYVQANTEDFEELKEHVKDYAPERMAEICGIEAEELRTVARLYARSEASIIFWGMGVSQHTHGTDNVRCLIAMALTTGQIGRPGTGLHPLRGQNNVQGASDAGLIPMVFPDYQPVDNTGNPRVLRGPVGHQAAGRARVDRGRDHGRDP